jgi:adenylate cyclase
MVGTDLAERLRRAGVEAVGQRRNVTVLFADISGFTALSGCIDGEDLYSLVQEYIRVLADNVYKYEGVVDKITGDGLMALYGAPISHENNAERAVRSALDMQVDLHQLSRKIWKDLGVDLNVRIGLHSGSVIVGGIGASDLMLNYTAIGDTVNLAHRIEEATPPGSILISEAVYNQVRAFFECQQVSVLNPKGIAYPVVAYRAVGLKARPGLARGVEGLYAPMIGRDQELILLKGVAIDLAQSRRGHFVLVTGEAGLGKSRLVAELKASLDHSLLRLVEGQSLAYRRVSYWLVREVFYSYLGLPATAPPFQVRERLSRAIYQLLEGQANEALPYLEHLLSLPYSDAAAGESIRRLEDSQLRQNIFMTVRDVFAAEAARRPLVMVLDDLHWADDASLELLIYFLDILRSAPVFILGISRDVQDGVLEKVVNWAQQNLGERFHSIQLQNLSLDQSKQLLQLLMSIPDLPENLREQILQRAAGIPFYLEEILRMLIDNGVLQNEGGRWSVSPQADISSLGVPVTLQELILARFDQLPANQRRMLQVASIIGKDFSLPVLNAVLRIGDPAELHTTIDRLVERDFISPQLEAPETEYTFRHILMSDAIYGTMLRKERGAIHGLVAEVIERIYADRIEEQVELLANHYRWSPYQERALHYLVLAGQQATRNQVYQPARQHFEAALEILPRVDHTPYQASQVYAGLGDVGMFFGAYAEAHSNFQAALQALVGNDGRYAQERSSLQRKLARTYERQGDYDKALAHLDLAQQALDISPEAYPVERAQAWNDIAWIHFRRGSFAEAQSWLQQALALVENTDSYEVIASIYNRLGGVAYHQGDWEQAADFLKKSIAIREATRDLVNLATSFNNLGLLEVEMGQYDSALENFTRSVELKTRLGQADGIGVALNNLGWLYILRGELEKARQILEKARDLAQQIGYIYLIRQVLTNFGELYLAAHEWEKARQVFNEAAQDLANLGASDQLVITYRQLGEAALGAGDVSEALGWASKAQDLLEETSKDSAGQATLQHGELHRLQGMLAIRLGDLHAAEAHLLEAKAIFENLRSRLEQGRVIYQLGVLAQEQGDVLTARQRYQQAAAAFRGLGARLDAQRAEEALKA